MIGMSIICECRVAMPRLCGASKRLPANTNSTRVLVAFSPHFRLSRLVARLFRALRSD